MNCNVCKNGTMAPGTTTLTFERNGSVLVFRDVPALVCGNCDEALVDAEVARSVLKQAEHALAGDMLFGIRRYRAA